MNFRAGPVRVLSDGELFSILTNEVESTSIIAFTFFDEEQPWHLVNHIRSLKRQSGNLRTGYNRSRPQ